MRKIFKKSKLQENIEALDLEIGVLTEELIDAEGDHKETIIARIEKLVDIRNVLVTDKVNCSHSKEIVSGAIALVGILAVLKYEQTDIITTKALGMATKLFRG